MCVRVCLQGEGGLRSGPCLSDLERASGEEMTASSTEPLLTPTVFTASIELRIALLLFTNTFASSFRTCLHRKCESGLENVLVNLIHLTN